MIPVISSRILECEPLTVLSVYGRFAAHKKNPEI
jgi:hypothetical protein